MKQYRNIFFVTFNGRSDNPGDMLIFDALVGLLHSHGTVYCWENTPWSKHLIRPGSRWVLLKCGVLSALSGLGLGRTRIFQVLPPGAIIWDSTVLENRSGSLVKLKSALKKILWALSRRKRIILGVSTVDPKFLLSLNAEVIGLRDEFSLSEARKHAVRNVVFCPDFSFAAEPLSSPPEKSEAYFSFRNSIPEDKKTATYEAALLQSLAQLVPACAGAFPGKLSCYTQVHEDESFNRQLQSAFADQGMQWIAGPEYGNLIKFYGPAKVVISNRLHVLLAGALAGALPVAVTSNSHSKVVSLFRTAGWEELIILTGLPDSKKKLEAIFEARDAHLKTVALKMMEYRKVFEDILHQVLDEEKFPPKPAGK